ncbi:hypothetical protein JW906_08310 [bacterium]|nr:hypothetical protein [bacterium]
MKKVLLLILLFIFLLSGIAEPRDCRLRIGMNLSGITDWGTELPFVDIMKYARPWMTKNKRWIEGGENHWNTGFIDSFAMDENGYPLEVPLAVQGAEDEQIVFTGWYSLLAYPEGDYVFLYEGDGDFQFEGNAEVLETGPGRIRVRVRPGPDPENPGLLELRLFRSNPADPARNMRLLMPGTESTYRQDPYYRPWLDRIADFNAIRFMDWGRTNNWGEDQPWLCYDSPDDTVKIPWSRRARPSYFTWSTNRGVPYEAMIDVCNRLQADMWICVPHQASDGYISEMAALVRDNLQTHLKIYVEYSNEIWNWMFGQTQWLYTFGCLGRGMDWPEGIVPYIQNCMDIWTSVFGGQMERLVRVVGVQAAWQDVSNRIVFNMRPGSFDAFAPAAYFGLPEEGDAALDILGASASVSDLLYSVEKGRRENELFHLRKQKQGIADRLGIPMLYYEGGQHITPHPFGEEPAYARALLDLQRDPAMYRLYVSWLDSLETLANEAEPSLFMHFSFVTDLSARYGSWGMLESITQDTSLIPAPKYRAIMEYLHGCVTGIRETDAQPVKFALDPNHPNPFNPCTTIRYTLPQAGRIRLSVFNAAGRWVRDLLHGEAAAGMNEVVWDGTDHRNVRVNSGIYLCRISVKSGTGHFQATRKICLVR